MYYIAYIVPLYSNLSPSYHPLKKSSEEKTDHTSATAAKNYKKYSELSYVSAKLEVSI